MTTKEKFKNRTCLLILRENMGIIKKTLKTAAITAAAGIAYVGSLWAIEEIPARYSEHINSESQLVQMIQEERAKIDPQNKSIIEGELVPEYAARCDKTGENRYKIKLGGSHPNRSILRHELYHILDGHLEGYDNMSTAGKIVDYLFWCEPKAAVYQTTGIKL